MREIWRAGRLTVKGAMEALQERLKREVTRNTTLVQLQRLEKKGWIRHEKEGRLYFYEATVGYEDAAAELGRPVDPRVARLVQHPLPVGVVGPPGHEVGVIGRRGRHVG